MKNNYDLFIIGAGAAGLAAAISFKRKCDGTVLVIDSNKEAGRKILATGNGRCNISNTNADGYSRTKDFFESLGVLLDVESEGRVYPLTRQAVVVRDALYSEAIEIGVEFSFSTKAVSLTRGKDDDFIVEINIVSDHSEGNNSELKPSYSNNIKAIQVILATGGKAAPQYQCMGDGLAFARMMGHKINSISPALTFLTYSKPMLNELGALKGVRAKASASVLLNGKVLCEERGEVQFTSKAISGICIFNLSREIKHLINDKKGKIDFKNIAVSLDLAPDFTEVEIAELLKNGTSAGLSGIVNSKLAEYIYRTVSERFNKSERQSKTVSMVKNFVIDVDGTGGWKDAQVTFGGIDFSEIDTERWESKAVPGLYFAGEILDYDGPCGGYNLDFAWNSGLTAGESAGGYCVYYKRNNS